MCRSLATAAKRPFMRLLASRCGARWLKRWAGPIGWDNDVELAANLDGWAAYWNPDWGQFTFGHTHTVSANSGLVSMTTGLRETVII